ncbi:MAG: GTPase [Deltaproteobacteria bacterium]|nr:GTPase [Deltaproteobacteria bacterium]
MTKRIIIMGAAGRDFHNFNVLYRTDKSTLVVAFTATQIPFIENRVYPASLAGALYPQGVPIVPEAALPELIKKERVDEAVFSYSDVPHAYIMERAALCASLDVDFTLLGAQKTMLKSGKPVISVCATRTGCGKSGVTRFVAGTLKEAGLRPVAIRHPMPYGNLEAQSVQRFASEADMLKADCTIEEMEEYAHLVKSGVVVYAGVDYAEILKAAEAEADVIIWDGGNNDTPFLKPDLALTVADPLRPGHENEYFHGNVNLRIADAVVINKVGGAPIEGIEAIIKNVKAVNPSAKIIKTASVVTVASAIVGKKVLVVEDGPTLTHGGMAYGAGMVAARRHRAVAVDPRPYAIGSIRAALDKYPRLENLLPAMGYSDEQKRELEETINNVPCDAVLIATPVDLAAIIKIKHKTVRVNYDVHDADTAERAQGLYTLITDFANRLKK